MIKLTDLNNNPCFIDEKEILAIFLDPLRSELRGEYVNTVVSVGLQQVNVLETPKEIMLAAALSRKEIQDLK